MPDPRDVNIDIVGHDKTEVATKSAEHNLDDLDKRIDKIGKRTEELNKRFKKTSKSMDEFAKKNNLIDKIGDKLEKFSGILLKVTAGAAAAVPAFGALQPVIIGITTALVPATAALGVFGAVGVTALSGVVEQYGKTHSLFDKIQLLTERAKVQKKRGDDEGAAKSLKAAALASAELRARYNLLDPAQAKAVASLNKLSFTWDQFVAKNTPRIVNDLARAFEFLIRTIPKLQPLFDAGADAVERFLGFIERKEKDGTIDRFIKWLTVNAGPAFQTVSRYIDGTVEALQTAWVWWGQLSTAVYTAVEEIKAWVLGMRLSWYRTLQQMYQDTAAFLRETAAALSLIPGFSEKTKQALLRAADGLDRSAAVAKQKANEIQAAIDSIHDHTVTVSVNTHYKVYGTPAGTQIPAWYGESQRINNDGHFGGSAGNDLRFSEPGGGRAAPPAPITVAPNVDVSVTIPGLGAVLRAMVRTEVNQRMGQQAFRAQARRAYT